MAEAKKDKEKAPKERRPQAQKRDLQSVKRNLQNNAFKSKVNTAIRSFRTSLTQSDKTEQKKKLNEVYSLVDKGVKSGVYKLNKASRIKSRFTQKVSA
jgi:small subunit ribosomal protein S20